MRKNTRKIEDVRRYNIMEFSVSEYLEFTDEEIAETLAGETSKSSGLDE